MRFTILLAIIGSILIGSPTVWLSLYVADGLTDALQKGYCYEPQSPNRMAMDWLGVRPEESADLFIRQFIDAYGTFDLAWVMYKGAPEGQVRPRPESWIFTRACVLGSKKSSATVYINFNYKDGTSSNESFLMWSDAGSHFQRLSFGNMGWLSEASLAFYKANPKYGRKSFYRDASEYPVTRLERNKLKTYSGRSPSSDAGQGQQQDSRARPGSIVPRVL